MITLAQAVDAAILLAVMGAANIVALSGLLLFRLIQKIRGK